MDLLQLLDHPPRVYTPMPFWFLNGDLTHREIRRQLRDFRDHGVYGVVLHPRMGLARRIGYLSPLFFRYIRTAVETAAELEMRVVLYDEGMYPSGSACGQVVAGHPELASREIARVETPAPEDRVLCRVSSGVLVERFSRGTLRGVHYGEDDGEKNAPASADILNPQAVERFIALTHEAYYRELKDYFGKTIIGFFTDEPSILGRNAREGQPWTRDFDRLFTQRGGCLAGLEGLFTGQENADTALYRRLILERECQVYYGSLSGWCRDHGIALMGHPHQSDDIEVQRYFHVPGQDLVYRWVSPETGGTQGMDSVMGKCSADMARLMGCARNSNECFGACGRPGNPWYFTGADMKWFIDWLAVRGVNLFIPHAFYYSLQGQRSAERPPDVGPGSLWWPHYRLWADYMARLSCLMANAQAVLPVAVLCRNRDLKPEAVAPLLESQRGFQYIPESFWPECRAEKGELVLGDRRYQAVLAAEDQFPGVPHDAFAVPPDVQCIPPQPDLRAAALRTGDRRLWLLVNEGEAPIETALSLPVEAPVAAYDLWTGERRRVHRGENGISLSLGRRESLLLYTCTPEEAAALPVERPAALRLTGADFTLESQDPDRLQKVYTARLPAQAGDVEVAVDAEEMAELHVNGTFWGVSFWGPHRFRVPAALCGPEPAALRLTVTGNLANRYGKPVAYGLKQEAE